MATVLKDIQGNLVTELGSVNNTTVVDTRLNTSNLSALNSEVFIDISKEDFASVDVRGTFVATLTPQFTVDGTNYNSLPVFNRLIESFLVGITAVGTYQFEIPTGTKRIRLLATAYTSGSAIVALTANIGNEFIYAKNIPSNLQVTATGAASATVTATLPASAGLFHYITNIRIEKFASALLTVGATPIIVTTTNLAGSRAYSFDASAQAQGTLIEKVDRTTTPIKSTTAGTATTIVCPVATGVIWRISVDYYLGA